MNHEDTRCSIGHFFGIPGDGSRQRHIAISVLDNLSLIFRLHVIHPNC